MKIIYKALKYPFFGDYMVKWRNPLDEVGQKEWERVTAQSKSGAVVQGLAARARTPVAKAIIVLGHPMGKEAKGYFIKRGYTDLLRENGYHVLVFDLNGLGESPHGDFSYYEDIIAVGKQAKTLFPDLPIGYHGISMGAQWATVAFADPTHPFNFAIVESAATTLHEFWVRFPFAYRSLKVLNAFMPKYAKKVNMIERIKEAKNIHSILFIYSATDEWVPLEMGLRFHENCPVPSELWTVEDAIHAELMKSGHKAAYCEKIIGYFDRCSKGV